MTGFQYRAIRHQIGLTQSALAAELGRAKRWIERIEKMDIVPRDQAFALRWLAYIKQQETTP